ncbi:MAG: endonuclease/exonuclease/phosphatase family protein [Alistipes sp.]|nr:endonuclease/exonuclease/phosphatase family protein [Alistipes sp.]
MADYYGKTYSSSRRTRRKRSAIGNLIDVVMGVVTIGVATLFILTLIVPRLDPREYNELSTLGLIAPFVYIAQTLLTLYWFLRWRLWVAVPMMLVALSGVFQLSLFYKVELRRVYTEPNLRKQYDRSAMKVLTYNVRSFIDDDGERCIDSVAKVIKALNPDILCLQEMGFSDIADSLFEPLYPMPRSLSRVNLSPAIYSRYPIVRAGRVDTLINFVWADVVIKNKLKDDTIRIFNSHLHTTAIRRDESLFIENHDYLDDDSLSRVRNMINRLAENNKVRAEQADTLKAMIEQSPYPTIVCGDFNDTPVSYTYRRVARGLSDAFREVGRGYSNTYRGFFDMLRIDYVFATEEFEPLSYEVVDSWTLEQAVKGRGENADTVLVRRYGNRMEAPTEEQLREAMELQEGIEEVERGVKYSDHYPVFVRLKFNRKTN